MRLPLSAFESSRAALLCHAVRRPILLCLAGVLVPCADAIGQTKAIQVDNGSKGSRLSAPQVRVSDQGDGCVQVTWTAIPGAKSYVLGRALGNNGLQRIDGAQAGGTTEYRDRIENAGMPVVYRVTAIDSMDMAGFPGTSTRFVASGGKAAGCPTSFRGPTEVVATVRGDQILVDWQLRSLAGEVIGQLRHHKAEVRHFVDGRAQPAIRVDEAGGTHALFPARPGEHRFEVLLISSDGKLSDPTSSNTLVVHDKGAGSDPGGGPAGPAAVSGAGALAAGAELSFAVSPAATLRPGGTTSAVGPAGAQWSSLDQTVATVTSQGTITARGAGEARIVGVGGTGSTGIRVTVMRVVVTP
jgi:hypothetical protein